jgi:hypothetical protein
MRREFNEHDHICECEGHKPNYEKE